MTASQKTTDLQAVVNALRGNDRFTVVTHENPDGDALGSLLATALSLGALGKDAVMFLAGNAPLAAEYRFLDLDGLRRELPVDAEERVLVAVDCANERRIGADPAPVERAKLVVNIDHHHDNSRFGDAVLVVDDASSTAEIVRDVMRELDVALTPRIAEALYVALVEDGADVHGIFRHVYETVQFAKLKLLARALDRARLFEGGRLVVSYLLKG